MFGEKRFGQPTFQAEKGDGSGKADHGPEYARQSASLFLDIPEDLLTKLESENGFPKEFQNKIASAARFFAIDENKQDLPAKGTPEYQNISEFLAHPLVKQKVFTLLNFKLTREKKGVAPTVDEVDEKLSEGSGDEPIHDAEAVINAFKELTRGLKKDELKELEGTSDSDEEKKRFEFVRKTTIRKMHLPADVDTNLYETYAWFRDEKSKAFLINQLKAVAETLAAAVSDESNGLEPHQRKYLTQYLLPLMTEKPEKGSERDYMTQLRNVALALQTYGFHEITVREEEGIVQSRVMTDGTIAPDAGETFLWHAKAFFEPNGKKKSGNPALPQVMRHAFDNIINPRTKKPAARNVVAAIKAKVGGKKGNFVGITNETVPDAETIDKFLGEKARVEQKEVPVGSIEIGKFKDPSYRAELQSVLANSGLSQAEVERASKRLGIYQSFYGKIQARVKNMEDIKNEVAASTADRGAHGGQTALPEAEVDKVKSRRALLNSYITDTNKLLSDINAQILNLQHEKTKYDKKKRPLGSVFGTFLQAYAGDEGELGKIRRDLRESVRIVNAEIMQVNNAYPTIFRKRGVEQGQRPASKAERKKLRERNAFVDQLNANEALFIPGYAKEKKDRTEDQNGRMSLYRSYVTDINVKIRDLRYKDAKSGKEKKIGAQPDEIVAKVQKYINDFILKPILDEDVSTFVNPNVSEKHSKQNALKKKLDGEVKDLIDQIKDKME